MAVQEKETIGVQRQQGLALSPTSGRGKIKGSRLHPLVRDFTSVANLLANELQLALTKLGNRVGSQIGSHADQHLSDGVSLFHTEVWKPSDAGNVVGVAYRTTSQRRTFARFEQISVQGLHVNINHVPRGLDEGAKNASDAVGRFIKASRDESNV